MLKKKWIIIICSVMLSVMAALAAVFIILNATKKNIPADAFLSSSYSEEVSSQAPPAEEAIASEESVPEIVDNGIRMQFSSPSQTIVNTSDPAITFTGTCDPQEQLLLNGSPVTIGEGGTFSVTVELNVGRNSFTFVHKGQTKTFTVNYRYVVIGNYIPSADQIYSSGSTFGVTVTARNGSVVTASFNGQTITLTADPAANSADTFINFSGSFTLPSDNFSDLSLGKITYTASFAGVSESFQSGNITCQKPDFVVDYDPNVTPAGGKYINVGSGKIAEIVDYQAETFDAYSTNDWSRPTNNYLPKGTVDYCSQSYVYYGNEKQYAVLRCGRQVYTSRYDMPGKERITVVKEYAGALPDHNEVTVSSFENTGRHTVLTLDVLWKAPFYFDILPQGYNNPNYQDYTISNVTYNYVDITFCYATVFEGEITIPEGHPIFSSAQIIQNPSDCTLRLHLKKQGGFYGWDCYYNDLGQLVFEFLNPASITYTENAYGADLTGAVILIDVGHGGVDSGAPGFDPNNHSEAISNLNLANKIKAELESIGATVYMTRSDNSTSTTDDKMTMIKRLRPDYCLAIHHDSNNSGRLNGFGSYYYSAVSKKAAEYVWMHSSNTGIYQSTELSWHYYFMGRNSCCPVVLTENGYMSNSFDYANIINEEVNITKAKAITKGIVEYFSSIQQTS